ncbi:MAG: MXAN_6640 family putative metalloprotease [Polyangiaceae bacterium]
MGVALAAGACSVEDGAIAPIDAPSSGIEIRPDAPGNTRMFAFDAGETVETFASVGGHFVVHYTRNGADAVPPADADTSGVPDYVELVASTYEAVRDHYSSAGFLEPVSDAALADNGGDGKFDVYLVDFAGQGDGHYQTEGCQKSVCTGFMTQENDFKAYGYPSLQVAVRTVASHEYFHAIQAAYDADQGAVLAEGTATWGTETFDATLKDFEGQVSGYMKNTSRPLDEPLGGAVDTFSYGTAIWFWFLEERYAPGLVKGLIERTKDGANGVADPQWFEVLDDHLKAGAGTSFADAFVEFSTWNLFTGKHADAAQGYAAGAQYPSPTMEAVTAPYQDDALRVYHASTQYLRAPADGRAAMGAALVSKASGDTDGLVLLAAVEKSSAYAVTKLDSLDGAATVDTTGADAVVLAIVNTNMTGESKRPALCLGSPEEITACKASLAMPTGTGGAGGSAASTTGAGGGGSDGDSSGGCSCSVGAESVDSPWIAAAAALALASVGRRARRRGRPSRLLAARPATRATTI